MGQKKVIDLPKKDSGMDFQSGFFWIQKFTQKKLTFLPLCSKIGSLVQFSGIASLTIT